LPDLQGKVIHRERSHIIPAGNPGF